MNRHDNGQLRSKKDRMNPAELARRAAKRQDRSTFRERVTKSFEVVGNGMQIFDLAIVLGHTRLKRLAWANLILWVGLITYLWFIR